MMRTIKQPFTFLFKCSWRATALVLRIDAKDEAKAWKKVESQVRRMQGGVSCESINLQDVIVNS